MNTSGRTRYADEATLTHLCNLEAAMREILEIATGEDIINGIVDWMRVAQLCRDALEGVKRP